MQDKTIDLIFDNQDFIDACERGRWLYATVLRNLKRYYPQLSAYHNDVARYIVTRYNRYRGYGVQTRKNLNPNTPQLERPAP